MPFPEFQKPRRARRRIENPLFDTIVWSARDKHRLTWNPFQASDASIMRSRDDMKEFPALIEVPQGE